MALLLGMRASEIVSRRAGDLDEDAAPGDLLWIPCAKTPAGRRTIEVPGELRPLLVACAQGKASDRHLFECERPHERAAHKPHGRDWVIDQVHRVCDLAEVPRVTAHAMRGLLATITAERGMAGTSSRRRWGTRTSGPRCTRTRRPDQPPPAIDAAAWWY